MYSIKVQLLQPNSKFEKVCDFMNKYDERRVGQTIVRTNRGDEVVAIIKRTYYRQ